MSQNLFKAAKAATAFSHSPYSKFPVGAAILADDGKVYSGANIENIAFPQGWCAETTALSHMIMGGGKRVLEIAVFAPCHPHCPPCGGCRQKLAEFADASAQIHMYAEDGSVKTAALGDLLPMNFNADLT
ncbi:cytidine deaminase [Asticcacaulis sp. BYS171W]|uniref:Cytidine deaminase n=1 Tax=Asticcacaulis aquaticus TaxID=2984212 RepID=A0ABT5HYA7_9CAUL|nr:cytidine deaminase [Asticcacaulis aquaticus]MDC7685065.1 cytidine deaminase [Asticcacaulis aquaticus]